MAIRHERARTVHYPERDGRPTGETPVHRDELGRVIGTLQDAFAGRPDVYVSGNMMCSYEEGNPRAAVSPDVFVTFGVPKLPERQVYRLWQEAIPATIIEIISKSTRREDLVKKRDLYAGLGVQEYFLYDPLAEYLRPALHGFRLDAGEYRAIPPDSDGALLSETLGMRLILESGRLRFIDRVTGRPLLSPAERADAEAAARRAAEARAAEAEAELARLRARMERPETL